MIMIVIIYSYKYSYFLAVVFEYNNDNGLFLYRMSDTLELVNVQHSNFSL